MARIKTLHFDNTSSGQARKTRVLASEVNKGWKIVSETITPGKFRGSDACWLFLICAPCAFLAGTTDGTINVTLQLDDELARSLVSQSQLPPDPLVSESGIGWTSWAWVAGFCLLILFFAWIGSDGSKGGSNSASKGSTAEVHQRAASKVDNKQASQDAKLKQKITLDMEVASKKYVELCQGETLEACFEIAKDKERSGDFRTARALAMQICLHGNVHEDTCKSFNALDIHILLQKGDGSQRDGIARTVLEQACNDGQGDANACYQYGLVLRRNTDPKLGKHLSMKRSDAIMIQACDRGSMEACEDAGIGKATVVAGNGQIITYHDPAGIPLLRKACEGNAGGACVWLASIYQDLGNYQEFQRYKNEACRLNTLYCTVKY